MADLEKEITEALVRIPQQLRAVRDVMLRHQEQQLKDPGADLLDHSVVLDTISRGLGHILVRVEELERRAEVRKGNVRI